MNVSAAMQKTVEAELSRKTTLTQSGIRIAVGAAAFAVLTQVASLLEFASSYLQAASNGGWPEVLQIFGPFLLEGGALAFAAIFTLYMACIAASFGLAREFAGHGDFERHAQSATWMAPRILGAWGFIALASAMAKASVFPAFGAVDLLAWLGGLAVFFFGMWVVVAGFKKVHGFAAKNAAFAALPFALLVGWMLWNALNAA